MLHRRRTSFAFTILTAPTVWRSDEAVVRSGAVIVGRTKRPAAMAAKENGLATAMTLHFGADDDTDLPARLSTETQRVTSDFPLFFGPPRGTSSKAAK